MFKNHLFPIIRALGLILIWPAIALGIARQWPGLVLDIFTMLELAMVALMIAGSATAIGFGQWRIAVAFPLLLMAWCALRFTGAPLSLLAIASLTLALLPWLRERGVTGPAPALAGAIAVLGIALWLRGGEPSAGIDALLFEPLDLPLAGLTPVVLLGSCGILAVLVRVLILREAVDVGLAGALLAIGVAVYTPVLTGTSLAVALAAVLSLWTGLLLHAWRLAYLDELTGLPNRRALEERIQRLPRQWSVAMLDIDHFKKFNDKWGHEIGDQVLRRVAAVLGGVDGGGQAYRYGGEEFAVIFPHENTERARHAIERLRQRVSEQPFRVRGERSGSKKRGRGGGRDMQRITLSAGLATASGFPSEAVFKQADNALYKAKDAGRNRLVLAG